MKKLAVVLLPIAAIAAAVYFYVENVADPIPDTPENAEIAAYLQKIGVVERSAQKAWIADYRKHIALCEALANGVPPDDFAKIKKLAEAKFGFGYSEKFAYMKAQTAASMGIAKLGDSPNISDPEFAAVSQAAREAHPDDFAARQKWLEQFSEKFSRLRGYEDSLPSGAYKAFHEDFMKTLGANPHESFDKFFKSAAAHVEFESFTVLPEIDGAKEYADKNFSNPVDKRDFVAHLAANPRANIDRALFRRAAPANAPFGKIKPQLRAIAESSFYLAKFPNGDACPSILIWTRKGSFFVVETERLSSASEIITFSRGSETIAGRAAFVGKRFAYYAPAAEPKGVSLRLSPADYSPPSAAAVGVNAFGKMVSVHASVERITPTEALLFESGYHDMLLSGAALISGADNSLAAIGIRGAAAGFRNKPELFLEDEWVKVRKAQKTFFGFKEAFQKADKSLSKPRESLNIKYVPVAYDFTLANKFDAKNAAESERLLSEASRKNLALISAMSQNSVAAFTSAEMKAAYPEIAALFAKLAEGVEKNLPQRQLAAGWIWVASEAAKILSKDADRLNSREWLSSYADEAKKQAAILTACRNSFQKAAGAGASKASETMPGAARK